MCLKKKTKKNTRKKNTVLALCISYKLINLCLGQSICLSLNQEHSWFYFTPPVYQSRIQPLNQSVSGQSIFVFGINETFNKDTKKLSRLFMVLFHTITYIIWKCWEKKNYKKFCWRPDIARPKFGGIYPSNCKILFFRQSVQSTCCILPQSTFTSNTEIPSKAVGTQAYDDILSKPLWKYH